MMKNEMLQTNCEVCPEDQQKIASVVESIEESSPSDASIFFKLDKVEDKYVGSVRVRSHCLHIDLAEENFDIESLIELLNSECHDQIKEWKKTRFV